MSKRQASVRRIKARMTSTAEIPLGDGGGQSHTGHVHIQLGDEENVQDHVYNARNGQVSQRPLGVSGGSENSAQKL